MTALTSLEQASSKLSEQPFETRGPSVPVAEKLTIETRLYGTINGKEFEFHGNGIGFPFQGHISTDLHTRMGPVSFPIHLLDVSIVMGYPTFSRHQQGLFDLFKISNGYEYERHMNLGSHGRADSMHKVEYLGDMVVGDFHVNAEIDDAPPLADIEPLVETMRPAGPGRIASNMTVVWRQKDGSPFVAQVESEYRLTHNATLPWVQFREVKFTTDHTPQRMRQTEELNVFRDVAKLIDQRPYVS